MDQMCMSMVKLQGRLQFSQANRAGAVGVVDERWWVLADKVAAWKAWLWLWEGVFFSDVVCCMFLVGFRWWLLRYSR